MMNLFDVYPRFPVTPVSAKGVYVYDENGTKYLDLYGGHGVISVGHSHPAYTSRIREQVDEIGFYSNSVEMPLQRKLAEKLGKLSGYPDYHLFLCNSGAEANENALKLASFHTGRKRVIAFHNSFHGRTSAALNVTDNPGISSPINRGNYPVDFISLNDPVQLEKALDQGDVCALIVEGIQGVGGLDMPSNEFLHDLSSMCRQHGTVLILDEIQSGYGRSGRFFAHQHAGIRPDLITVAKGMGNGFPIGGVLISPSFKASAGLLGTTFGGNHLACAAGIAVLDILENEGLMKNAQQVSLDLLEALREIPNIRQVKGKGLMMGVELDSPVKELRARILMEDRIFTGSSANPNLLRILPPLCINQGEITPFIHSLKKRLA